MIRKCVTLLVSLLFSLKLDDVKDAVKDLQGKTCKYVDLQEFSQYVNLPVSSELSEIFDLYDKVVVM